MSAAGKSFVDEEAGEDSEGGGEDVADSSDEDVDDDEQQLRKEGEGFIVDEEEAEDASNDELEFEEDAEAEAAKKRKKKRKKRTAHLDLDEDDLDLVEENTVRVARCLARRRAACALHTQLQAQHSRPDAPCNAPCSACVPGMCRLAAACIWVQRRTVPPSVPGSISETCSVCATALRTQWPDTLEELDRPPTLRICLRCWHASSRECPCAGPKGEAPQAALQEAGGSSRARGPRWHGARVRRRQRVRRSGRCALHRTHTCSEDTMHAPRAAAPLPHLSHQPGRALKRARAFALLAYARESSNEHCLQTLMRRVCWTTCGPPRTAAPRAARATRTTPTTRWAIS